jgi:hypothetical protein
MSRADVDTFKAYLATGDIRFHPAVIEKQAAMEHDFQVKRWKLKMAQDYTAVPPAQTPPAKQMPLPKQMNPMKQRQPSLMQELDKAKDDADHNPMGKEARGGHPANIAFARMMRPGLFPGLDADRGVKVSVNGDFNSPMGDFFRSRIDPGTLEYLYGQEKLAEVHGKDGPSHIVESTQDTDIESDGEAIGVAIKKQEIETKPKMEGNEKEASSQVWWFDIINS